MAGLKPIVEFMTWNFAMQAIDQIINSAAKTLYMSGGQISSSIVFRGPNGAACARRRPAQPGLFGLVRQIPGLKVIAPYDAADAKGLLKSAIRDPNPVIFLEHEMLYGVEYDIPDVEDWLVPIGKAKVRRVGADVTITAHSRMVDVALKAADKLAEEGIDAEVIDLRTLRPLDTATIIESVKKTNRSSRSRRAGADRRRRRSRRPRRRPSVRLSRCAAARACTRWMRRCAYAANLEALALPGVEQDHRRRESRHEPLRPNAHHKSPCPRSRPRWRRATLPNGMSKPAIRSSPAR